MTKTGPDDREPIVGDDVDRAWRALSREAPPASLDASILAAAHREAGARPERIGAKEARAARRRWWPIAAAATVAAIAVGVLQVTPTEDIGGTTAQHATVSDMPSAPAKKTEAASAAPAQQDSAVPPTGGRDNRAPSDAPPVAAAPRPVPTAATPAPMRQETRPAPAASPPPLPFPAAPKQVEQGASSSAGPQAAPMERKEAPVASAPPAPPAATGGMAAEQAVPAPAVATGGMAAERAASAPAVATGAVAATEARPPEPAPPAAAPLAKMAAARIDNAAPAARVKDRAPLSIPDWIALIRRLRGEGNTVEAAKELAAFRAAHADHEKLLPPDLRDWHEK